MKKQLVLGLGLAVLATPVLASKARLEALGEDNFGSYYIQDNRNIFLNAAKIHDNADLVTYEFGSTSDGASTADSAAGPRAEGGFIKSSGSFVWGAHFGNSTPSAVAVRAKITNAQERAPIDLFFGGDAGVKWGANVTYENYDGEQGGTSHVSSTALRTRLGVVSGDSEAFAQVSLSGNVKNRVAVEEMDGKSSYFLGFGHMLNNYKLFADYLSLGADYGTLGDPKSEYDSSRIRVGAGRQEKLNDRATMFTKLMVSNSKTEDDVNGGNKTETTITTIPVVVGLEYDAISWLTFRASVTHNLYGNEKEKVTGTAKTSQSVANTDVRAGATLKFGDLAIDGMVGTDADGANAGSATTDAGQGSLRTDQLMTRVSATYRF